MIIANHQHTRFQIIGFFIERMKCLTALCLPDKQAVAFNPGNVKGVQRAPQIKHHIVGDIDKRADRALPDRFQPLCHPVRAWPVFDPAKGNAGHQRCQMCRIIKVDIPAQRAVIAAIMRAGIKRLQRAMAGRCQVTCHAAHTKTVGPVRGNRDFDDRIIQTGKPGKTRAHRGIVRQVDDAVMLIGNHHLAFGAEHAVGILTADIASFEFQIDSRHIGAGRCENTLHAGACIRRTADNLHRIAATGIHHADTQAIRIGVLFGRNHLGDGKGGQCSTVVKALYLQPQHWQGIQNLLQRMIGIEMVKQPVAGEFHQTLPPTRPAWMDGASNGRKP